MSEVVEFPAEKTLDARQEAGERHIITVLKDALAKAERGELHAVAIAMVIENGSTREEWAAPWCNHRLMSAITYLQHRYAASEVSGQRDD
jgi:hypothetical protein